MEFRIWVETRLAGRILERELVAQVERPTITPEEIGLSLEEGKTVLRQVQARMIQTQADVVAAAHWRCHLCGRRQRIKDRRTRCVRTVFGTYECPAAAFCVVRVEAEEESRSGRLMIGACRVPHRSFSICTLHGAAGCLIVKRRQCWRICFPLALMVCPMQRCGATL